MFEAGYEPFLLDIFDYHRKVYVNVVVRRRTASGYGFHGKTGAQYQSIYEKYKHLNYQPFMVDSYLDRGRVRYAGYFEKTSGPRFAGYHGASSKTHQDKFDSWIKLGYFPTSLSVVSVGDERKYTAIYKKKSQGSIYVCSTLTTSAYRKAFDDNLNAGRRVSYLNGYVHRGRAYLVAIFNSVTPNCGIYSHGLSGSQYQQKYEKARASRKLTRVPTGYEEKGRRYAAGWRQ